MQFPARDLTQQYISSSYQDVTQNYFDIPSTTWYFLDGYGNVLFSLPSASYGNDVITVDQTASYAYIANTASFLIGTASWAYEAVLAIAANFADYAQYSETCSLSQLAIAANFADYAQYAETASIATSASWAPAAGLTPGGTYPITTSWAINTVNGGGGSSTSSFAISSSVASQSLSASYAITSSYSLITNLYFNIDGGNPSTIYGGILNNINGGTP